MERWIPIATVRATVEGFAALGLDSEALLTAAELDRSQLSDSFAAIPRPAFTRLWQTAARADGRPLFFVRAGRAVPLGAFGLVDHLVSASSHVGEAFRTLERHLRLVCLTLSLSVEVSETEVRIELEPLFPDLDPRIFELWCLALLISRFESRLAPRPFEIREITSTIADPPGPRGDYTRFWQAPVRFSAPRCGLRLDPATWQLELGSANAPLHGALEAAAHRLAVETFLKSPVAYAVRARIEPATEPFEYQLRWVSADLGMSPRSLQRRLAAEGSSFRELVDGVRRQKAEKILAREDLSLHQVAARLGYNEQSSFNRAFQRWMGLSPRAWRKQRHAASTRPSSALSV